MNIGPAIVGSTAPRFSASNKPVKPLFSISLKDN